jgi:hypothetical protein
MNSLLFRLRHSYDTRLRSILIDRFQQQSPVTSVTLGLLLIFFARVVSLLIKRTDSLVMCLSMRWSRSIEEENNCLTRAIRYVLFVFYLCINKLNNSQ